MDAMVQFSRALLDPHFEKAALLISKAGYFPR